MWGRARVLASVSVAVVLGATGLSACGSGTPDAGGTSAAASATASASASPSPASTDAPDGMTWAESQRAGMKFAVPEDWTVIDPKTLFEKGDKKAIADAAAAMNVTSDQLQQAAGQIDLMVFGTAENGFSPNVNVVPNGLKSLPSADALAAELKTIEADPGEGSEVTTPLGKAVLMPYTLQVGSTKVQGRSIVVGGPNGFATITVSHTSADGADEVTQSVLDTLAPL